MPAAAILADRPTVASGNALTEVFDANTLPPATRLQALPGAGSSHAHELHLEGRLGANDGPSPAAQGKVLSWSDHVGYGIPCHSIVIRSCAWPGAA